MGTRYGRRASDGTTEYYDSKAELVAAASRDEAGSGASLFMLIGAVAGGLIAYFLLHRTGAMGWPKLLRFVILTGSAIAGGFLLRVTGRYLVALVWMLVLGSVFVAVGKWLWHLV